MVKNNDIKKHTCDTVIEIIRVNHANLDSKFCCVAAKIKCVLRQEIIISL